MAVIIRLQNLPLSANAIGIRLFFKGLTIPDGGVNIVGGEDGDAFIAFGTDDDARQAMHLNGQKINGAKIRLLLSSKHEMQTIINNAKKKLLKRNINIQSSFEIGKQSDKKSITYYTPESSSLEIDFNSQPNNKIRIIDYSIDSNVSFINNLTYINNKENNHLNNPPRPSEFSYKFIRSTISLNNEEQKTVSNNYNVSEECNNNNNSYFRSTKNINLSPIDQIKGELRGTSQIDEFLENESYEKVINEKQWYNNKSLLPTPLVNDNPPTLPSNNLHDYTERPQWLDNRKVAHLKPSSSSLVRIVLPYSIICPRTVFDLFRNISIVPKKGIKIEQDKEKRFTGYVYVLLVNTFEATKALKLNKTRFRGLTVPVELMVDSDFDKVVDRSNSEQDDLQKPLSERSPYYRDFSLEISNLPQEITEKNLKDYLNISIDDKKMHLIKGVTFYCLLTASDELMMENILKFNGSSCRDSVIKVVGISKFQLETFLTSKDRDIKSHLQKPLAAARKYLDDSKNMLSCAKLENVKVDTKAIDLVLLFKPVTIPLQNIIINNTDCIVDFISPSTCQSVIKNLKDKHEVCFTIVAISSAEFQSLKTTFLNLSGSIKSVPNIDKRIPRGYPTTFQVRMKNLPKTVNSTQVKDLIRDFEYQPQGIQICYDKGINTGQVILTFKKSTEAIDFKNKFHGVGFMEQELEVMLSEN